MTGPTIGPLHPRVADRFDGSPIPDLRADLAQRAVDATVELLSGYRDDQLVLLKAKIAAHGDKFVHHLSKFGEHYGWGMWFRNWLRGTEDGGPGILDAQLNDTEYANWDDYYCEVVVAAVKQL
jgi:hypothetical protein